MCKLADNAVCRIRRRLLRSGNNRRLQLFTILLGALLFLGPLFAAGVGIASAAEAKGNACSLLLHKGAEETIPNKYLLDPGIRRELQKGLEAVFSENAAYEKELDTTTLLSDEFIGPVTRGWLERFCNDFPVYGTAAEVPGAVARSALHYAEISAKHPDWKQTVASSEFDTWVRQAPADRQLNKRQLRRSGAAPVVIRLLDEFAASQGTKPDKPVGKTDEASCKRLLGVGKNNKIPSRYLASAASRRNIQKGLQTVYSDAADFQRDLERSSDLSDGKIGPVTRKWLERFCGEYPVSGLSYSVPGQVVQSALHYAEIAAARSDWKSVVTDPGFNDWIRGPVPKGQPGNRPFRLSGSAPIVAELINESRPGKEPTPIPVACPPVTDENAAIYYELTKENLKSLKDRAGFLKQVEGLVGKTFGTEKELKEAIGPTADLLKIECIRASFQQTIRKSSGNPKVSYRLTEKSFRALRTNLKLPTGIEGQSDILFENEVLNALKELQDDDFATKKELAQFVRLMIKVALEGKDPGAQDPRNAPQPEPASRKTEALIESVVKQVVAKAETVSPYEITVGAVSALNEDPLFVAFPEGVLKRLKPLLGIAYPDSRIFRTAVSSVLSPTSAGETKTEHSPASSEGGAVPYVDAIVTQARKEGREQTPLQLSATDCGCSRKWDTVGKNRFITYGFYPFWLSELGGDGTASTKGGAAPEQTEKESESKDTGPAVDFGVLNRIGYFAVELNAQGGIAEPRLWTKDDGAADFLAKAHRFSTKVDLVVEARGWQSWDERAVRRAAIAISSLLDSERTSAAMIPDGIALYFPAAPSYPTRKPSIVALVSKLHDWLVKHEMDDLVSLNIMLDGGVRDLAVQIESQGAPALMGGLKRLLLNEDDPAKPAMVDLVLVFLDQPVGDTKRRLRLAVENQFSGDAQVDVLRKILPIIPPNGHELTTSKRTDCGGASDQFWQLQGDLIYFRDNFRGVAFWPLPNTGYQDEAVLKERLQCTFAKSQAPISVAKVLTAVYPDLCTLVCPNRLAFRIAFAGLTGLLILVFVLARWSCRVRSIVRKRFRYLLLGVALWIVLLMALVSCDPVWNEYELVIVTVIVAILAVVSLIYYVRKVKQGVPP